ncbi:sodium:proton antiporter [Sphingomonas sp. Leaf339]|uniref:Na+/H+ antiporter subunit E n=1 Tax=Sphingomonas sp. Leaf339 TaxID=1736343 RepID=UPI0006FC1FBF|nr:Na+/H+ antiporter subunit E [Sphingomonas sp. Leaf339]KQU61977.1 sodium:proton antiporter [Sphingomonas sp. Leaf339]
MSILRKAVAVVLLAATFVADLFLSSLAVARLVLSPRIETHPAIVMVPVAVERPWAVALFACFTSLTPGSTCLHVAEDRRTLYLHVLDTRDPAATIARFKRLYERHIAELER